MNTQLAVSEARSEQILLKKEEEALVLDLRKRLPLEKFHNAILKRMTDLLFSTLLIILIFPWLVPIVAILIKFDSRGPVFFLQKRHKKNGKIFRCVKFRTMVVNSDADIKPASINDQRITRVGDFLRHHHLDELPQLWNVWMGDMSLIGPRPYMISDNREYAKHVKNYSFRHKVKPGITGLAQSYGYYGYLSDHDHLRERVEWDYHYVRNWSLLMDLKIILRTFLNSLRKTRKVSVSINNY